MIRAALLMLALLAAERLPADSDSCCGPTAECEFCEVWQ